MPHKLVVMTQLLFPADTTVLLRHPLHREPERFEQMMAHVCDALGIEVQWCQPEPGGRHMVFFRDIEMVGKSDLTLAFFADDQMSGGTEHVVEKAIDQRVPVYSYGTRDGQMVLIGSHDPDNAWGSFTV